MKHILETILTILICGFVGGIISISIFAFIQSIKSAIEYWEGWSSIANILIYLCILIFLICGTTYMILYS
jgi:hypothetical protein